MSPIGDACFGEGCPVSAHAATGWCLVATGLPVIVVTTVACPPAEDGSVTVTLVDPSTGTNIEPQAVQACGNIDWEVNQLCDYAVDGTLIATFVQVFEWDEDTGVLIISNVRADNPAVAYVPTGTVRSCTDDQSSVDIEITEFCYDPEGGDTVAKGWHAWLFLNGVHTSDVYYDAAGTVLVGPTIIECADPATEATLAAVLAAVSGGGGSGCVASAAFTHGQNTDIDSGADEQIVVASNPACNGVLVKAMPLNTGIVYVGLVGVTTVTGYPLEGGDTVTIPVDDANKVYAITDVDNQAVAWIAS